MKPSHMLRIRRGIEPIVAAIILVVAAIVGGILLYLWTTRMISTATGSVTLTKPATATYAYYDPSKSRFTVVLRFPIEIPATEVGRAVKEVECYFAINDTLANITAVNNNAVHVNPNIGVNYVYNITITNLINFLKGGYTYYCRVDLGKLGTVVTPTFTVPS